MNDMCGMEWMQRLFSINIKSLYHHVDTYYIMLADGHQKEDEKHNETDRGGRLLKISSHGIFFWELLSAFFEEVLGFFEAARLKSCTPQNFLEQTQKYFETAWKSDKKWKI